MSLLNDRVLLFRDERINSKDGNVYIYIKEDNGNLSVDGTNQIFCFCRKFKEDNEALSYLDLYQHRIEKIQQIRGLNNITDILFIHNPKTLSRLADILAVNLFNNLGKIKETENILYINDPTVDIKKENDGYVIGNKDYNKTIKPELIINESFFSKKCIKNTTLFIKSLPDGLILLKDTNPDRNILFESI